MPVACGLTLANGGEGVGEALVGDDLALRARYAVLGEDAGREIDAVEADADVAVFNPIENLNGILREVTRRVKRWRDGKMVKRWIGPGILDAERGFRRLRGHKSMPVLVAALAALLAPTMWVAMIAFLFVRRSTLYRSQLAYADPNDGVNVSEGKAPIAGRCPSGAVG